MGIHVHRTIQCEFHYTRIENRTYGAKPKTKMGNSSNETFKQIQVSVIYGISTYLTPIREWRRNKNSNTVMYQDLINDKRYLRITWLFRGNDKYVSKWSSKLNFISLPSMVYSRDHKNIIFISTTKSLTMFIFWQIGSWTTNNIKAKALVTADIVNIYNR